MIVRKFQGYTLKEAMHVCLCFLARVQYYEVSMIKSRLIEQLSAKMTHHPEKTVTDSVNHIIELMSDAVIAETRIEIRGFGSFSLHNRQPRRAHNPKTGEKMVTSAKFSPHFKPGKELRERVDASKSHTRIEEDV